MARARRAEGGAGRLRGRGATRQAEAVHLADDGIAGDAAAQRGYSQRKDSMGSTRAARRAAGCDDHQREEAMRRRCAHEG